METTPIIVAIITGAAAIVAALIATNRGRGKEKGGKRELSVFVGREMPFIEKFVIYVAMFVVLVLLAVFVLWFLSAPR